MTTGVAIGMCVVGVGALLYAVRLLRRAQVLFDEAVRLNEESTERVRLARELRRQALADLARVQEYFV